jgi:hypothetical protein
MYTGSAQPSSNGTSNGWLEMPGAVGDLFDTDAFTISTYVKFDSDLNGNNSFDNNPTIWAFSTAWGSDANAGQTYPAMMFWAKTLEFSITDSGWANGHEQKMWNREAKNTAGTWIHVLYKQSGTVKSTYINGVLEQTSTTSNSISPSSASAHTHTIQSVTSTANGKFRNNFIGRPVYGDRYMGKTSYADFNIYNSALSDEQIAGLGITETLAALNQ